MLDEDKRQPLMNKLEPSNRRDSGFARQEVKNWSRTGREATDTIMRIIEGIFNMFFGA